MTRSLLLPHEKQTLKPKPHSFTLKPSTIEMLRTYADTHNSNMSRVVETLVLTYLPAIMAKEAKAQDAAAKTNSRRGTR